MKKLLPIKLSYLEFFPNVCLWRIRADGGNHTNGDGVEGCSHSFREIILMSARKDR